MFDLRDLILTPASCYVAALDLSVMGLARQAGEELIQKEIRLDILGQVSFFFICWQNHAHLRTLLTDFRLVAIGRYQSIMPHGLRGIMNYLRTALKRVRLSSMDRYSSRQFTRQF